MGFSEHVILWRFLAPACFAWAIFGGLEILVGSLSRAQVGRLFLAVSRGVSGAYQSRIRAVSGPYQGRIRAVSRLYEGRIRAASGPYQPTLVLQLGQSSCDNVAPNGSRG